MRNYMRGSGHHTYIVPLKTGYDEYTEVGGWVAPGTLRPCIWRRTVSLNHVVWC